MNISFYTAAVGAQQQQDRLDVYGNNIANVNTYGFRAKRPSFASLMTGPVRGILEDLPRGVGSRMIQADTDFAGTGLADTGRSLDYAIEGYGFFALEDPADGSISYTRDGSFTMSELDGRFYLSDGRGRYVLDQNQQRIEIPIQRGQTEENQGEGGEEGEEQAVVPDANRLLPVGIFDFANYNGMLSLGDNRFAPIDKNGEVLQGTGRLRQTYVERSNTDLAHELSKVIEAQRSFSYMLKMVITSDEIETTVNNFR